MLFLFTPGEVLRLSVEEQHCFSAELSKTHWPCKGVLMIILSILLPGKLRHRKAK